MSKGMKWTEADLEAFQKRTAKPAPRETEKLRQVAANRQARQMLERVAEMPVLKRAKYSNEKVTVDGEVHDSKKEAARWKHLQRLEREGAITDLKRQVKFELVPGVKFKDAARAKPAIRYYADHTYLRDGVLVVEDTKSAPTRKLPAYRMKKHMLLAFLGLEITEV